MPVFEKVASRAWRSASRRLTPRRRRGRLRRARDFKDFDELKERLCRARPKDSTLDQRRGMEAARAQGAEQARPAQRPQQEPRRRQQREAKERGQGRQPEAGQGDPIARFKQAQKEFIQVAGIADFDPRAKCQ